MLLLLLCVFMLALARLVSEGQWYYVAVIITGLFAQRQQLEDLWKSADDE